MKVYLKIFFINNNNFINANNTTIVFHTKYSPIDEELLTKASIIIGDHYVKSKSTLFFNYDILYTPRLKTIGPLDPLEFLYKSKDLFEDIFDSIYNYCEKYKDYDIDDTICFIFNSDIPIAKGFDAKIVNGFYSTSFDISISKDTIRKC